MKDREALKLYHSITNIEDRYIQEAQAAGSSGGGKRPVLRGWGMAAACLCLICILAVAARAVCKGKGKLTPDSGLTATLYAGKLLPGSGLIAVPYTEKPIPDSGLIAALHAGTSPASNRQQAGGEQEPFVAIDSLLAAENPGENLNMIQALAAAVVRIPTGQYTGVYEKVSPVDGTALQESRGKCIPGAEGWYYVSGHKDMQYLIREKDGEYTLWKFVCFDSEEYPYSDVLTLVYQIDSADGLREIVVRPPTMDNSDGGKALQEKIGIYSVTDREEIDEVYQILSSLTCYGQGHWERIDYGAEDGPADRKDFPHQAVWLGRYLSILTDYGNEIDGLKYTAVSDMFYEFSGIAYDPLTPEQAERVCEILKIGESGEEPQYSSAGDNAGRLEAVSMPQAGGNIAGQPGGSAGAGAVPQAGGTILAEAENTGASLEYITELQDRVSSAMTNGELAFVALSAVYENPYRLHVEVTTDSEGDLERLKELDTLGGAIEIEYISAGRLFLEDSQGTDG